MIKLLRHSERRHLRRGKHEIWHSFAAEELRGELPCLFAPLIAFDELRLAPGGSSDPHCEDEAEIVTYVYKGSLSQKDTLGNAEVMHAGEFQRRSMGCRVRYKETSATRGAWVQLFRIALRPSQAGIDRGHEQGRFTAAQRHNVLCVIASPDGRKRSLRVHQNVLVFSAVLDPGHHLVHELERDRGAWLHLIDGEATLDDMVLTTGDGAGVSGEPSLSLTAQENTEILVVDLGPTTLHPLNRSSSDERPAGAKREREGRVGDQTKEVKGLLRDRQGVRAKRGRMGHERALGAADGARPALTRWGDTCPIVDRPVDRLEVVGAYLEKGAFERKRALFGMLDSVLALCSQLASKTRLYGRIKSLVSVSNKTLDTGLDAEQVLDIIGIRVVTARTRDCYRLVRLIHDQFPFMADEYDDYIVNPKPNGYRSIHTTVVSPSGLPIEIQLRTAAMHEICERGSAAHSSYKRREGTWIAHSPLPPLLGGDA